MQALQRLGITVPSTVAIGNGTSVQLQDSRAQQLQQQLQQQMQQQLSQLQSQQQKLQQQQVLNKILSLQGRSMHSTLGMAQPPREDDGTAAKSASESGTMTENSNNSEDIHSLFGGRFSDGVEEGEVDSEEIKEFFR